MRRFRLVFPFVVASAAVLAACIVAPDEPKTNSSALSCTAGQRAFNGACRQICKATSECAGGLKCMHVGGGETLCLDYGSCAYLGSDTSCGPTSSGPYGYGGYYDPYSYDPYTPYTPYDPYMPYDPYSPYTGGGGCVGNAIWTVAPASGTGTIECGLAHDVQRCQPVAGACVLVNGSASEIAEP